MASSKPVIHGKDHLPWGADPIPEIPLHNRLPIITAEAQITSLAYATPLFIDLSTGTTRTNDGLVWIGTPSDPFTGTYYQFDWGTDPTIINIIHPGVYLIRFYWWILSFSGSWAGAGPQFFGMTTGGTGDWGMANDSSNIDGIGVYQLNGIDFNWKVKDERVVINTSGTSPISYSIEFVGQPSLAVSDSYAGFSIIRLGDIT